MSTIREIWFGHGAGARAARAALTPFAWAYEGAVRARGALFDAGVLRTHTGAIPAISIGNLTVGGTGKTPVAAWIAQSLQAGGARPAIVLRGYGDDEPLVHARLNPGIPVIAQADRVAGMAAALARGADVAVLDDAFQHRRAARTVDVVLVSADEDVSDPRLLPAGPWREPPASLARASLVVVTRKAVGQAIVNGVIEQLRQWAPRVPVAVVSIAPHELVNVASGEATAIADWAGHQVRVVSAIGNPDAFARQLAAAGLLLAQVEAFPDHHAYVAADVARLASGAAGAPVVTTLKDAVKLGPIWPRAGTGLWYVSQRLVVERGGTELDQVLLKVLSARVPESFTAG
ncbi:MAG: Tetraacyldisaccharide 4-kinase [Gemmatimonadetes bacterium]|nr:Tetraacyldisaccharide 4-kinase [Gemmatimonadota bacterium]